MYFCRSSIDRLYERVDKDNNNQSLNLFKFLNFHFPGDVGVLSAFFLNEIFLKKGFEKLHSKRVEMT